MSKRKTALCALFLAVLTVFSGCQKPEENTGTTGTQNGQEANTGGEAGSQMQTNPYENYEGEPYVVRTILREYAVINPDTGRGAYGRYTELKAEGKVPDTFRDILEECNRRAEESVRTRADQTIAEAGSHPSGKDKYQYDTFGYIVNVTRADHTAFSILETEFEKEYGQSDSDISYRFRGATYDTASGEEIALDDLLGDEEACSESLKEALSSKYGIPDLASTAPTDYAWTVDVLGIRFYFNSDAVSEEKRTEIGDYTARAVTAGFSYDALPGGKARALAASPDSYIAMMDRETTYNLPHGDLSVLLTKKEDEVFIRILEAGKTTDLRIEYADDLSDFYIIRAEGGFYLFRERAAYKEGFFYDFAKPDGGFGRFAYNTAQYFDSFLSEIQLALPYNPYCAHMAEVRRSLGESSYDTFSFTPHGHYRFPSDPKGRYKRFLLTDEGLQIDSYNMACRLLEDFPVTEIDSEGNELGEITVPAGNNLFLESVIGEAARYDDPPKRSYSRTYQYICRTTDGTRISFVSNTTSTVSSPKGYVNRFATPISLGEALYEEGPEMIPAQEPFTVQIGGKDYPLIPDYTLPNHSGEEIDFGDDIWWQVEGYVGRYVITEEDLEEMRDAYFTQDVLSHPGETVELVISEDGSVVLDYLGEKYTGSLPKNRCYHTYVILLMESESHSRSFQLSLREGEWHTPPGKIEVFSEGEPATNVPSTVPPITVYLTHVTE